MEEQITQLTCGFRLVTESGFGRCGKKAEYQVLGNPICEECAKYMKMRGLTVYKMRKTTVKRKLAELNSPKKQEVATA